MLSLKKYINFAIFVSVIVMPSVLLNFHSVQLSDRGTFREGVNVFFQAEYQSKHQQQQYQRQQYQYRQHQRQSMTRMKVAPKVRENYPAVFHYTMPYTILISDDEVLLFAQDLTGVMQDKESCQFQHLCQQHLCPVRKLELLEIQQRDCPLWWFIDDVGQMTVVNDQSIHPYQFLTGKANHRDSNAYLVSLHKKACCSDDDCFLRNLPMNDIDPGKQFAGKTRPVPGPLVIWLPFPSKNHDISSILHDLSCVQSLTVHRGPAPPIVAAGSYSP